MDGPLVIVTSSSDNTKKAVGVVRDYAGATRTVMLLIDPGIFTIPDDDEVDIVVGGPVPLWLGAN
jgi:hypothetical protein